MRFGTMGCLLAVMALGLAGCLEDDASMVSRYAPGSDRFGMLTVYEHFRSVGSEGNKGPIDADAESLLKMWNMRDRIVPFEPSIFSTPLYAELAPDHKGLAKPDKEPPLVPISWEKIEVIPGKMFKDAGGALGYFHETWIPGEVMDQWLKTASLGAAKNAGLIKGLTDEQARRDAGGKVGTWKDLTGMVHDSVTAALARLDVKDAKSRPEDEQIPPAILAALDAQSLAAVRRVVEKGELSIARKGSTVTLTLPLSQADAAEAKGVLAEIGKVFAKFATEPHEGPNAALVAKVRERMLGSLDYKVSAAGLELSWELVGVHNAVMSTMGEERARKYNADPAKIAEAKELGTVVGPKVTVSEGVDVAKVLAEFKTRTVK